MGQVVHSLQGLFCSAMVKENFLEEKKDVQNDMLGRRGMCILVN
jgi:hypothetical protein